MAIKIKAQKRKMNVGEKAGEYLYMMNAQLYEPISQAKVLEQASKNSGLAQGVLAASWDAIGQVVKDWATEGHSCPIPGLGTMRFGLNARAVSTVDEVGTNLIESRKVIFTPNVAIKQALKDAVVTITCYDEKGNVVKEDVTSSDVSD